jgi:multisubunit Na+/H+ antiporter MnhB subunit
MTSIVMGALLIGIGVCLIVFRRLISSSAEGHPFRSPSNPVMAIGLGVVFAVVGAWILWTGVSSLL